VIVRRPRQLPATRYQNPASTTRLCGSTNPRFVIGRPPRAYSTASWSVVHAHEGPAKINKANYPAWGPVPQARHPGRALVGVGPAGGRHGCWACCQGTMGLPFRPPEVVSSVIGRGRPADGRPDWLYDDSPLGGPATFNRGQVSHRRSPRPDLPDFSLDRGPEPPPYPLTSATTSPPVSSPGLYEAFSAAYAAGWVDPPRSSRNADGEDPTRARSPRRGGPRSRSERPKKKKGA